MYLDWRKVNWFSKLLAVGLLFVILLMAYIFGAAYQQSRDQVIVNLKRVSLADNNVVNSNPKKSIRPINTAVPVGWKTYVNEPHGYEISYPPTFTVNDGGLGSVTTFISPDSGDFSIDVLETGSTQTDIFQWADSGTWPFSFNWRQEFETTKIQNLDALRDPVVERLYFKLGSKVYSIENGIGREDKVLIDTKIFNQILSTIRFTGSVDNTSDWKTYRNEAGKFTVQYPALFKGWPIRAEDLYRVPSSGYITVGDNDIVKNVFDEGSPIGWIEVSRYGIDVTVDAWLLNDVGSYDENHITSPKCQKLKFGANSATVCDQDVFDEAGWSHSKKYFIKVPSGAVVASAEFVTGDEVRSKSLGKILTKEDINNIKEDFFQLIEQILQTTRLISN